MKPIEIQIAGLIPLRAIVAEDKDIKVPEYLNDRSRPKHPRVYLQGQAPVFDVGLVGQLDDAGTQCLAVGACTLCLN